MNTNTLITIIVVIAVIVGGFFFFFAQDANAPEPEDAMQEMMEEVMSEEGGAMREHMEEVMHEGEAKTVTITYTDEGYAPADVSISLGDTVTFVNESSRDMWPASNIHPTHTVYPGSSIQKCNSEERNTIFDACEGLPAGELYAFTFSEAGAWKYHDHLRPREGGTISVQ